MNLSYYLEKYRKEKSFCPSHWVTCICESFNSYLKEHNLSGAVISVSGGIDSSVTLALLKKVYELENSNLKKIYAVNQPIHSSDWSVNRSKELCDMCNVEMITVDQTDTHDVLVEKVNCEISKIGNLYSQGQFRSYLRTPINYYLSQLLNESGYSSVVVGTGNKDEDGYLGYYCKYGDGGVDIQLISKLHKSEVYAVGRYLELPASILNAPPSADLWEGQEDEKDLGVSYDFIELYTGYYLPLSEEDKMVFLNDLNEDSKTKFVEYGNICENVHKKNSHKFKGIVNL